MDGVFTSDYRDLDQPQNFVWRSPKEQTKAALYFLHAGAVESFHVRINYMRAIDPDFMIDLRNTDLANLPLWRVNLSRSDMRGALLDWTDLKYGSLAYADLRGASLVGASLMGANLRGANLSGADLRGVNLSEAIIDGCNLADAVIGEIPEEWFVRNSHYRKGSSQTLPQQNNDEEQQDFVRPSLEGAGGNYEAKKRNYSNNVRLKPVNAMDDIEEQARRKREQDDRNFKKWQQKKSVEKRVASKKAAQQNKYLQQKSQDQKAFERKQREQEQFLERQRKK